MAPARFAHASLGNGSEAMQRVEPSPSWIAPEPPVAVPSPMLVQEWRHCAFLHWSFDPDVLRPHVPPNLELDLHAGLAWASLISFSIPTFRPGSLPPIPGMRSGAESHLRTYVVDRTGRRGIWMLGVDIEPLPAAVAGRIPFLLPYWWASIRVERSPGTARYRSVRRFPGGARVHLELRVGQRRPRRELSDLDNFLTARWVLYAGIDPVLTAIDTEHPRWQFRETAVERLEQTVTRVTGLPDPGASPLVHFSDGVVARLGRPRRVAVGTNGVAALPPAG